MTQVLVLNSFNMPIAIIPINKAMKLLYKEKADVVDYYEDINFNTYKEAFFAPAVLRLKHFTVPSKKVNFFKSFTRRNVWERDAGTCQYCGGKLSLNKMTFDHVIPKDQQGKTNWTNIVTACFECNQKKRNRTPEQANMKLKRKPFAPIVADSFIDGVLGRMKDATKTMLSNSAWRNYIYWEVELIQD